MTDKYQGKVDDRTYAGEDVDIQYSLKRCIHAKECVNHLSQVFDVNKRPWIDANGASGNAVAQVIDLCPSGALHYTRNDDGDSETTPEINQIILWHDGPLQVKGDLAIQGATVAIEDETRATLCRCGASANKPFCDNTHKKTGFVAEPFTPSKPVDTDADTSGKVTLTATKNGSLKVEGNFRIENIAGDILYTGSKTWLCRCGGSSSKPFCDGTHNTNGFEAE